MASKGRLVWYGLGGLSGAALLTAAYYAGLRQVFDPADSASAFGDAFGGLSAVLSALATIGVVVTLAQQQDQMKLQRDALNAQLEALTAQREELALQRGELALQREEMAASRAELRKSAEAQEQQIAVMRESALAARAQVAAFGAEGVERFIENADAVRNELFNFSKLIRFRMTDEQHDAIAALQLPSVPIFCSSQAVVNSARSVRRSLDKVRSDIVSANKLRYRVEYPNERSSHEERERARTEYQQTLDDISLALRTVASSLASIEEQAAEWFMHSQESTATVGSTERPVTAPEEQAS